jgi:anaerobic magnesium-protoporphyrin IX monomethyl ester cyclase
VNSSAAVNFAPVRSGIEGGTPSPPGSAAIPVLHRSTVLLVVPPQIGLLEGFSSGVIGLANHMRLHEPELDLRLLDLALAPAEGIERELAQALATAHDRCFVGITTTTATYQAALAVARVVQRIVPSAVIVLGGHHASAQDDVVLERHGHLVRVVVRGEGETSLLQLVRRYPLLHEVPGISFLDRGRFCRTAAAPLLDVEELDRIDCTFGDSVRSAPGKFGHITYVSARGCPLKCAFCSVANQQIRAKSVAAVLHDLRYLVQTLGYTSVAIEDNFFAHSPNRTLSLCTAIESLRRELPFRWDCQTRVESMTRQDVVEAMARAGCEAVYLGVEALTEPELVYLGKTSNPRRYIELLEHRVVPRVLATPMEVYINLQLAVPGSNADTDERMLERLARLGAAFKAAGRTVTVFPQLHVVYPGTAHFASAIRGERFGPDTSTVFERFTEWEGRQGETVAWLGSHFAHGVGGIPEGILDQGRLRYGDFAIDPRSLLRAQGALDAMVDMPGVLVFQYRRYLAQQRAVVDALSEEASA